MTAINLGQALALWIRSTPPQNTSMLWYDTNLVGSGNRIKFFDQISQTWELITNAINSPFRISLTEVSTEVTIQDQGTNDYFIEVISYITSEGIVATTIPKISLQGATSFTVTTASGFETGVFIYRILKF